MAYNFNLNNNKYLFLLIILSFLSNNLVSCIEPITGLAAVTGIAGMAGYGYLKSQTYCRYYECCDERSIPGNINELERRLSQTLFGQHMVKEYVIPALAAHLKKNSASRKPLVMSFHGTPGVGKSFVADQIAAALYREGSNSIYVHKYLGRADFAHPSLVEKYKERINREVRESVQNCPRSLFIFEEVDKMPHGVFDSLTSLIDYAAHERGSDFTKSIFIFLSNTAGVLISNHLGDLMKKGVRREDTRLSHFEEKLQLAAYNTNGGLKKTHMIEAHVIDHYIPFLALEKAHIVQCVEAEFSRLGISPKQEDINNVISAAIIYDPTHNMFATSGCKTIEKKVAMIANRRN